MNLKERQIKAEEKKAGMSPSLYHAGARNSLKLMPPYLDFGMDSNSTQPRYASVGICHDFGFMNHLNITEIVRTLLEHGADLKAIPEDMWFDYFETSKAEPPSKKNNKNYNKNSPTLSQSKGPGHVKLAAGLNLYQWYCGNPSCHWSVKMPNNVTGQDRVTKLTKETISNHIKSQWKRDPVV
ncbi:hypothetical protein GQ43DRAFT_498778 [Delitschia confertaspora ATCC 74209]|uniref:Ankyrin repeat protein n=1 Tax=Delitschia confertaspora ATCC 74209 TaxID=1513339 RepID=A0A9P4JSF3_9PLEO|nr:hypothetical protein GQ43DRAFT_498778 [Delitschia confertaspora ATCC 74209]